MSKSISISISMLSHLFSFSACFCFLLTAAAAQNCTNPVSPCDPSVDYFPFKPELEYITTATLDYKNTFVDVTVTDGAGISYKHRLVKCGCTAPNSTNADFQVISVPPRRLYIDDSPSLAFVADSLSQRDRIVAIGHPERVYSRSVTSRITEPTSLAQLANGSVVVDMLFVSTFGPSGVKEANVTTPYFVNGESQEPSPLARGEWIKIFAIMFDAFETANGRFREIETRYKNMKKRAEAAQRRPSVLVNFPSGGSWGLPSENQYVTEILRDANVDYLFMNDGKNTTNFETLDDVVKKFKWARYLLHSGQFPASTNTSMKDFFLDEAQNETNNAIAINKALKSLAAVRCANIWSRSKRISDLGSNDYFEWGAIRPDLILEDIVRAVHRDADVSNETTFSYKIDDGPDTIKGGPCLYADLMGAAPDGMIYVDTEMSVRGKNRFEIENQLVEKIIPEVSKDERIPASNVDAFFEKPQENNTATLLLRTMVKEEDSDEVVKDSEKITEAVGTALGDGAEVEFLSVKKSSQVITITEEKRGLSGGAIAGIVVGALLFAAVVGVVLFAVGTRRGATVVDDDLRDRFWNEHGVRLADDVQG